MKSVVKGSMIKKLIPKSHPAANNGKFIDDTKKTQTRPRKFMGRNFLHNQNRLPVAIAL